MSDLAATLQCLICGRWWITAVGGHTGGNGSGSTLCPRCEMPCKNCGTPLTLQHIRDRRGRHATTPPACSMHCSGALIRARHSGEEVAS